jgi:hypothetical protein
MDNEKGVVQNVEVVVEDDVLVQDVDVPPIGNVEDNVLVQDVLDVPPINNLPKLNWWKLNCDISVKNSKLVKGEKNEAEIKVLLTRASHNLHVERKVSHTMIKTTRVRAILDGCIASTSTLSSWFLLGKDPTTS